MHLPHQCTEKKESDIELTKQIAIEYWLYDTYLKWNDLEKLKVKEWANTY